MYVEGTRKERQHDEENSMKRSLIISTDELIWAGYLALMGEERNACRILIGKPEVKKPLGRVKFMRGINADLNNVIWERLSEFIWLRIVTIDLML
jgi:hypothetical protein